MENKSFYVLRYPEQKPDPKKYVTVCGGHEVENISILWSERNAGKYAAFNICPYAVDLEYAKRFSEEDIENFRQGVYKWFEFVKIDEPKEK